MPNFCNYDNYDLQLIDAFKIVTTRTVAELIGVHSYFYKFEIVIVYVRNLRITTMHTTHTCMYGLNAIVVIFKLRVKDSYLQF